MSTPEILSESYLIQKLRERYAEPEWALLPQVRNQTGYSRGTIRTADAIALSLFPSRGYECLGFEIKISRSDWQQELKNPAKAEAISKYCHRWWVFAPEGVVKKDELPVSWGLLEYLPGGKLKAAKMAPVLHEEVVWDRSFVAAVFRKMTEYKPDAGASQALISKAWKEAREAERRTLGYELEQLKKKADAAEEALRTLETTSGYPVTAGIWRCREIGEFVKKYFWCPTPDKRCEQSLDYLEGLKNMAEKTIASISENAEFIRKMKEDYEKVFGKKDG